MTKGSRQQLLIWLLVITGLGLFILNWIIPTDPPSVEKVINEEYSVAMTEEGASDVDRIHLSENEWRQRLSEEEFTVLREQGTEPAFSGELYDLKEPGTYLCAACALPLFSSEAKYESGTGWPSFWQPIQPQHVDYSEDRTLFLTIRTEVHCARCGGHLGHVFDDGPPPTGKRYCINSIALNFQPIE